MVLIPTVPLEEALLCLGGMQLPYGYRAEWADSVPKWLMANDSCFLLVLTSPLTSHFSEYPHEMNL